MSDSTAVNPVRLRLDGPQAENTAAVRTLLPTLPGFAVADCGFTDRDRAELTRICDEIAADPVRLRTLAVLVEEFRGNNAEAALRAAPEFGPEFDLALLFALLPQAREMYRRNGWTDEMFQGIVRDLKLWLDHGVDNTGEFGISRKQFSEFYWVGSGQMLGYIVRLGRLQCNVPASPFYKDIRVIQSRTSGETAVLLDSELAINADGRAALDGEPADFVSRRIRQEGNRLIGHMIARDGRIFREPSALSTSDWTPLLSPGDPVINFHIPADGPMDWPACVDSLRRMLDFFQRRGEDVKGFVCSSWILDPAFPEILPATSNLVRLQSHGHLLPGDEPSVAFERVFGFRVDRQSPETWPEDTTMRKRFAAFLRDGGKFRDGRILLFPNDLQ